MNQQARTPKGYYELRCEKLEAENVRLSTELEEAGAELLIAKAENARLRAIIDELNTWLRDPESWHKLQEENKRLRAELERCTPGWETACNLLETAVDAAESSAETMGDFRKLYLNRAWIDEANRLIEPPGEP